MSDLDDLMTDDPLKLGEQRIEEIVAFYRRRREGKVATPKQEAQATVKIDLQQLGLGKPKEPVKRRF